jgi:hypothetical protein
MRPHTARCLRIVAVLWAVVAAAGLWGLVTAGWLAGFGTWAAIGFGAVWFLGQFVSAVSAAVIVCRRPRRGSMALAGAVLLSLPLVAWMTWVPHRWGTAVALVAVAVVLVWAGMVADRPPEPGPPRRPAWRVALDEPVPGGIGQDAGRE